METDLFKWERNQELEGMGRHEGEEDQNELRCVMYMNKFPTVNGIII